MTFSLYRNFFFTFLLSRIHFKENFISEFFKKIHFAYFIPKVKIRNIVKQKYIERGRYSFFSLFYY